MPDVAFLTKIVPAVTFAGAREVVRDPQLMRERCIAMDEQARQTIKRLGLKIDGPCGALYYPSEDAIDVEMGYPVRAGDLGRDDTAVHVLASTEVAYAVYIGRYDDYDAVTQVHVGLRNWVESQGTTSTAPVRELYIQPSTDAIEGVMELQYPFPQVLRPPAVPSRLREHDPVSGCARVLARRIQGVTTRLASAHAIVARRVLRPCRRSG